MSKLTATTVVKAKQHKLADSGEMYLLQNIL